ncbi:MAG: hypothetical protein BWY88_00931 [Synergistetes bacterium ADurb.Bin520]|nr:MAG: hypothetical protein BWY88_00931 [Synergistetes bacterium ADurb.Bin520]
MGVGKPHVERRHPPLGGETHQEKGEKAPAQRARQGGGQGRHALPPRKGHEPQESHQEKGRPQVGHDEVEHPCLGSAPFLRLKNHQEEREQRHGFPEEEKEGVRVGHEDPRHGHHKGPREEVEHPQGSSPRVMGRVSLDVDRHRQIDHRKEEQEKRRQGIETNIRRQERERRVDGPSQAPPRSPQDDEGGSDPRQGSQGAEGRCPEGAGPGPLA